MSLGTGILDVLLREPIYFMDTTNINGQGESHGTSPYLTPVAVLLGAVIIAFAVFYGNPKTPVADEPVVTIELKDIIIDKDVPLIGNPDAPVTIVVWEDYQCPICKALEVQSMGQIYENYVVTGKAKLVFKEFQFLGPDSVTVAEFGHAVWKLYPQLFYQWHTALFAAQGQEHSGWATRPVMIAILGQIPGIDAAKVAADVDANKENYDTKIAANRAEANALGVQGTPSMLIGNTFLDRLRPYTQIKQTIDAELAK